MPAPLLTTEDAVQRLRAGGVLLMETDTLPGLHARADRPEAVARIAALKGRPGDKALLVLAASADQARAVTAPWSPAQARACAVCWPGPFTLILPGAGGTLAVRVPAPEGLRDLLEAVGGPLVSTSANAAGDPPARDLDTARALFGDRVDGVWALPGQRAPATGPSALVDLTREPFEVLREGPEPFAVPRETAPDGP